MAVHVLNVLRTLQLVNTRGLLGVCYPVSLPPPLLPPPSCAHGPDVYRTRRELTTVVSLNNEQLFHDPESRLTATVRENIPTEKPFSFSLSLSLSLCRTHTALLIPTRQRHTRFWRRSQERNFFSSSFDSATLSVLIGARYATNLAED